MRMRARAAAIVLVCVVSLAFASCGGHPATRVLFVGNSFTFYNGGIDAQLARLAPSVRASSVAVGGYTLDRHWHGGTVPQAIRDGHWTYVVLQEQSQLPVIDPAMFRQGVTELDRAIAASGARTILLMTWERPDSVGEGVTTANLAAAYDALGAELKIKVAPVGLAFADALAQRPGLVLYGPDGHPTVAGTYLAACVVYETILGRSPVGIADADKSISAELRDFFQQIAAQSLVR